MKTNFLLPHRYKAVGWILLVLGIVLGLLYMIKGDDMAFFDAHVFALVKDTSFLKDEKVYFSMVENNILDEISGLFIILGSLMVAFSKEKQEDEFISKIRMESLLWATYVNYAILMIAILFIYDMLFFWVLVFNMFTILLFFLIRFHWALRKTKKAVEE